jgi:hypothetical protein
MNNVRRDCDTCRHLRDYPEGRECEAPGFSEYELGYAYAWERRGTHDDCGVNAALWEPIEFVHAQGTKP